MVHFSNRIIPTHLSDIVTPNKTALLLWDLQNGILSRIPNSKQLLLNIVNLRNAARRTGITVFYSQQTPFDLNQETDVWIKIRMRRAGVNDPSKIPEDALEGTKNWEITDELTPLQGDIVFKKRRPSAFIGTDFNLTLKNMRIETVILAGVTTESGIEGSARHGLNLGYYMVVAKDCTGSVTENRHTTALKSMETFFELVDSTEIISLWETK